MKRGERTDDQLAPWAKEHLVYEVDTMVFALEQLAEEPEGMRANVALESFAVLARCLFEFLCCKPNPKYDNDAFASDFSDEWNGRRDAIPPNLAEVKDRHRFGEEVSTSPTTGSAVRTRRRSGYVAKWRWRLPTR